ncbi:MAG TPA: malto-oligosyltrehalose trehalohydrolase [Bryobacteraceae bacterium]|nr:malto-oligosyltrehalose trehalohydrolase [Bryobacteraceae bacterium]
MANRRYPIGAELLPTGGAHFRVWAPRRKKVEVVLESGGNFALEAESGGYYSGSVPTAGEGTLYRFRLDGAESFPDPASRFQPQGPHGPSQVVDPCRFHWSDADWPGISLQGQVIYEMHIGTFTREGTFEAARRELPELAATGITSIEVMPVADFPGRFGWGYDGVGLFAPVALYGTPDDFRRLIDDAHRHGLGVILDVVYNHVGPDGNYLKQYSEDYFTTRYGNEWGEAINYDGVNSGPVREWAITNAAYWISEYHVDGLRLDATHQIFDTSPENVLTAIARHAHAAGNGRGVVVFAENDNQEARLARPVEHGGYGIDAVWNDDFHHTARVAMTGRNEAYYMNYRGSPQEFLAAVKHGYLYQGQAGKFQGRRRGTPAWDLKPAQFVICIQNHDQISNAGRGQRIHQLTGPGRYRAMTALLLLAPGTPLLFQGQEFAASSPFCFFADHNEDLAPLVREGRAGFLAQFPSLAQKEVRSGLPDPGDPALFERCKLDFSERRRNEHSYALHRDLLRLRREDACFRAQRPGGIDGAVLASEAFVLRYFGEKGDSRLLIVNLGLDLDFESAPEPLLAPPENQSWRLLWSSEDPRYGGSGTPPPETEGKWHIPGHAAVVMHPGV